MSKILEIKDLQIDFVSERSVLRALDGISLHLNRGETLGIVGESGSGKSVTALSIMRLLPASSARVVKGEIRYFGYETPPLGFPPGQEATHGIDLLKLQDTDLQLLRGREIAMIFQEPMTSLNPVLRCGQQVAEAIQWHKGVDHQEARAEVIELFKRVQLSDPFQIFEAYPHALSGGQKQRVMIAMAMSCRPRILIADEPTTALDVTVQKGLLDLLRDLKAESALSMIFISHDLGVIAEICDRVAVMHQGKIVEEGRVEQVLHTPEHPYTKGLIQSRPSLRHKMWRLPTVADFWEHPSYKARVVTQEETLERRESLYEHSRLLLDVRHLQVRYPIQKNWLGQPSKWLQAVDDVSFRVFSGETFGLVGESGCGKSTLGRAIARLQPVESGQIFYKGTDLVSLREHALRPFRREIQIIFQDPYASLNPRMRIGEAIMEPMQVHHLHGSEGQSKEKTIELMEMVGLEPDHFGRYPHEFSGGQRQRICIARALAVQPKFLICDEIVSSLDVSVQATVLNLLLDLREKMGLTYLFISHDLSVIRQMCDQLLVMNQGRVEALGFPEEVFEQPPEGYVRRLVEAVPTRLSGGFSG